jgi:L-methionine (R)-S-oxide reductase
VSRVDYGLLERQVSELVGGERNHLANAANFAAFVFQEVPEISWAGFYYAEQDGDLVLGPFGGRPACTRLPRGRGVCGAAYGSRSTLVIDDVEAFPDHIVCDAAARSEMVVPLRYGDEIYGVFDLDSLQPSRFTPADRVGIERLVRTFSERVDPPSWLEGVSCRTEKQ